MAAHLFSALFAGIFCVAAICFAPFPLRAQDAAVPRPKSIVLIYADDLGYGDVGCYGETEIPTPNLDKLASQGVRFLDAHSSAATCTPSRYSLITGQYAFRKKGTDILAGDANLIITEQEPNLPSMLEKAGYATGIVGKWHLGLGHSKIDWNGEIKPGPTEVGFDYEFIMPATLDRVPCVYLEKNRVLNLDLADPIEVSYNYKVGDDPTGFSNPELLKYKADAQHCGTIINGVSRIGFMKGGHTARWVDETMADLLSDKVVHFMEENTDKPFFLYYAMTEPHVPRIPNQRFVGKTKLGVRGDVIVQLDWAVGKVLAALDRLGLSDDTLVIFSSDNGPVLNDGYMDGSVKLNGSHKPAGPYRGGKYDAYEGGTRLPLIVRWPKYVKPGESNALICQMDLFATLASLTGQAQSKWSMDSQSLVPALLGKTQTGRESLVEQGSNALGLRIGNWKYIEMIKPRGAKTAPVAKFSLYDLENDPGEKTNLSESNPQKTAEMKAVLEKICGQRGAEIGDGGHNDED